jgi:hypothetical protein
MIDAGVDARRALGNRARERIVQHFSLASIVHEYEQLYTRIHEEYASPSLMAPAVTPEQRQT